MREYGQIQCNFWVHPDIQPLSDQAKNLALYLISGPHSNALGCYRLPSGYAMADLQWSADKLAKAFLELKEIDLAIRDEKYDWIFLPKFLRWNPIANPNVGKNVAKFSEAVPKKCCFYKELVRSLRTYATHLPNDLLNRLETVSEPFRIPEPEPDPEPKPEPEPEPTTPCPPADVEVVVVDNPETGESYQWGTPEALAQLYNNLTPPTHPKVLVRKLSPARRERARKFLKAFADRAFWEQSFGAVNFSAFLRGERNTPGHEGFIADFDWFIQRGQNGTENCQKALDGKYHDRKGETLTSKTTQRNLTVMDQWLGKGDSHEGVRPGEVREGHAVTR